MVEEQIDWRKTVEAILENANRPFVPISKSFIQQPRGSKERSSVLSQFVTNGDLRGLKAYLLIAASASSPDTENEWYTSLPLQTWARAFGCSETAGSIATAKAAATRILLRLQQRGLIEKSRCGKERKIKIKLLAQDGSGEEYQRPASRYIRLSHDFWKSRFDEDISLPALAMFLVVAWRTNTMRASNGTYAGMVRMVRRHRRARLARTAAHWPDPQRNNTSKEAPLSPTGITVVNEYYVCQPFDKRTLDSETAHARDERRRSMSELIAWGDESVQTQGGVIPTYYMGACICGLEERDIRRQLLSATKRKVSKLHWRDMTLSEKRRSIPVIEALSLPHIAIAATPLDGTVTSERARRKCLELLLPTLEKEYGISRLVLESRETSQDDRDLMFVRGLRSRRFISRLRVDFAPAFPTLGCG